MSLVSIVNLSERLLNQGSAQGQDSPNAQKTSTSQAADNAQGAPQDLFTPSGQTGPAPTAAQEAGLFSAAQFSFFSAAADFLLGQTAAAVAPSAAAAPVNAGNGNATSAGAQVPFAAPDTTAPFAGFNQTTGNGNAGTATGAGAAAQVSSANGNTGATAAAGAGPAAASATTAATANTAAGATAAQQQLQALNLALRALGLSAQDIQVIDRVAAIVNDYNPGAFIALTFQLEQLAQQLAQPSAAPADAAPQGTATDLAAQNGANGTNQPATNGESFHLQELVIRFAGAQAQAAFPVSGAQAAAQVAPTNGPVNLGVAAFDVQIEEVSLTLRNGDGGSTQVQAPGATTNQTSGARARVARA